MTNVIKWRLLDMSGLFFYVQTLKYLCDQVASVPLKLSN